jgi:hypothetical protein
MMTHMRELHSWSFSAPKRAAAGGKEGRKARRIHAEEKEQTREETENKGRKRKAKKNTTFRNAVFWKRRMEPIAYCHVLVSFVHSQLSLLPQFQIPSRSRC